MLRVFQHRADIGYPELTARLKQLEQEYDLELISIGTSVLGNQIWTLRLGWGAPSIYISGAYHGCEWLTTPVLLEFIQAYLAAKETAGTLYGVDITQLSTRVSLWITPLVNPDGVTLARQGLTAIPSPHHQALRKWNYGSENFREWKANIRGVDLNRQFRADWQQAYQQGPKTPAPKYFAGENPESEPESRAVADFTRKLNPEMVLAYHSQGEVIYWNYKRQAPPEARRIARELSRLSSYSIIGSNPDEAGSGGFKDWFISQFGRPGFTVEIGKGTNPLPVSQFDSIWAKNAPLLTNLGLFVTNIPQISRNKFR